MKYQVKNGGTSYKTGCAKTTVKSTSSFARTAQVGCGGNTHVANNRGVSYRVGCGGTSFKTGGCGVSGLPSGIVEKRRTVYNTVIISTQIGEPLVHYGQGSLVPSNTSTTICSYTVPTGKIAYIRGFYGSGDADAQYTLNTGIAEDRILGSRSTTAILKVEVDLNPSYIQIDEGTIIKIKVIHYADDPVDFEGCIIGNLINKIN